MSSMSSGEAIECLHYMINRSFTAVTGAAEGVGDHYVETAVYNAYQYQYGAFMRYFALWRDHPKLGRYLGSGRHRATFEFGRNCVIKMPICLDGIEANTREARNINGRSPACRLVGDCLIARRVRHWRPSDNCSLPDWAYTIDCRQVGFTQSGKLVAYDNTPGF